MIKFYEKLCLFVISAVIALIPVGYLYSHAKPKDVSVTIASAGYSNEASKGSEIRIYYIEADKKRIDLQPLERPDWNFDGSLVSYGYTPITFHVSAIHQLELSIKRGGWTPVITVDINGDLETIDLYSEKDNIQYNKYIKINPFWNKKSIIIYFIAIVTLYLLGTFIYTKVNKKLHFNAISTWNLLTYLSIISSVMFIMAGCLHAPWSRGWVSRWDISVFISIGKLLNQGLVLYKDMFDHKGPLLFWVNGIGCAIWYPYGVWILETLLQIAGYIFCYYWLNKRFSKIISLVATVFTIISSTTVVNMGNYSESWSLPFIFLSLYIFSIAAEDFLAVKKRYIFICGISGSIVMFMRPNCVVPWIVGAFIIFYLNLTEKKYKNLIVQSAVFISGMLTVIIPVCLYFIYQNAFYDFLNATFLFNINYAKIQGASLVNKITGLIQLYKNFKIEYLGIILIIAVLGEGIRLYCSKGNSILKKDYIYWFELIGYIIVFSLLNGISGRSYSHYGIIFLPALGMAVSYTLEIAWNFINHFSIQTYEKAFLLVLLIFVGIKGNFSMGMSRLLKYEKNYPNWNLPSIMAANYIESKTKTGSKIGVWGDGHYIHAIIDRSPASKFFFSNQENIMPPNFQFGVDNLSTFLENIKTIQPEYFIAYNQRKMPESLKYYITSNYIEDSDFVKNNQLVLYKRKPAIE